MTIRSYQYQVSALITSGSSNVEETVAQSLGVTDAATFNSDVTRSVAQALGLTDEASSSNVIERSVAHSLGITDTVSESLNDITRSVAQLLIIGDVVSYVFEAGGVTTVVQSLGITDEVHVEGIEAVVQSLGLTDEATFDVPQISRSITQNVGITDAVTAGFKVQNLTVEQDLGLSDLAGIAKEQTVAQNLGLTDEARFTDTTQSLGLTDLAEWGYGYDIIDTLLLTDEVEVDKVLNQVLTDDLGLTQAVAYFIETPCARYEFNTFHGTGGVEPTDKPLTYGNKFLLQSLNDGTIVNLRNPENDHRRRTAFNRVNRTFFDGTTDIYSDPNWVTEETQLYTIVATKRDDLDTVHQFLLDNLGLDVALKDWEGVTWKVMITNPGEVYTEDGEGYWTLEFECVGERVEGELAANFMSLSDTPSRAGSIYTRDPDDSLGVTDQLNRDWDFEPADSLSFTEDATFVIE